MKGNIVFQHTTYFTNYREACDTEVCGYTHERVCHYAMTIVDTRGPGHDGPIDTRGPGHDHDGPIDTRDPGRRSDPVEICETVEVPQYCRVNCRNVAFEDSTTSDIKSPVVVTIKGVSADQSKKFKELMFGVKTNSQFQDAMVNPGKRPAKAKALFDQVSKDDKTIIVLRAKGFKLRAGQNFLNLASDFKAGDAVAIDLEVESAGESGTVFSAAGTSVDFPELHTSSRN